MDGWNRTPRRHNDKCKSVSTTDAMHRSIRSCADPTDGKGSGRDGPGGEEDVVMHMDCIDGFYCCACGGGRCPIGCDNDTTISGCYHGDIAKRRRVGTPKERRHVERNSPRHPTLGSFPCHFRSHTTFLRSYIAPHRGIRNGWRRETTNKGHQNGSIRVFRLPCMPLAFSTRRLRRFASPRVQIALVFASTSRLPRQRRNSLVWVLQDVSTSQRKEA